MKLKSLSEILYEGMTLTCKYSRESNDYEECKWVTHCRCMATVPLKNSSNYEQFHPAVHQQKKSMIQFHPLQ